MIGDNCKSNACFSVYTEYTVSPWLILSKWDSSTNLANLNIFLICGLVSCFSLWLCCCHFWSYWAFLGYLPLRWCNIISLSIAISFLFFTIVFAGSFTLQICPFYYSFYNFGMDVWLSSTAVANARISSCLLFQIYCLVFDVVHVLWTLPSSFFLNKILCILSCSFHRHYNFNTIFRWQVCFSQKLLLYTLSRVPVY